MTEETEKGMDPDDIVKIIKGMPQKVNVVGMAELFANILNAYDMHGPKARDVLLLAAMMHSGVAETKVTRIVEDENARRVN